MKRRDFCKALALSAAALAVPRAAAENTQGAVGRAVADGRYSMRFRSELSLTDVPHDYYYSDSFFAHSALEYDHSLALASLGLVGAAFNTAASDGRPTLPTPLRRWALPTPRSTTTTSTWGRPGTLWATAWPGRPSP